MPRFFALGLVTLTLVTLTLPACTRVVARSELDELNRSIEVETILLENKYSLYSPYGAVKTAAYERMITEEHRALSALFGIEPHHPILIQLVPVSDLGLAVHREVGTKLQVHEARPVVGYASAREVVVYVARNENGVVDRRSPGSNPSTYRSVLRHELAHIFIHQLDLPRSSWIQEGIAEVVETMDLADGRLDRTTPLRLLTSAVERWQPHSIGRILDWQENGRRVEQGVEKPDVTARKLAMTLVRFLLTHLEERTFVEALREISSMTRPQLLDLEPQWQEWLWQCTREAEE